MRRKKIKSKKKKEKKEEVKIKIKEKKGEDPIKKGKKKTNAGSFIKQTLGFINKPTHTLIKLFTYWKVIGY